MNLKRLEELTATPAIATPDDLGDLIQLSEQYPYAQYLKILISKVAQHVHDLEQINKLNSAAIYSADRNVLKKVITDPDYTIYLPLSILDVYNNPLREAPTPDVPPSPGGEIPETVLEEADEASVGNPEDDLKKSQSTGIFGEVMKNLDKLRSLRKKYTFLEKKEKAEADEHLYSKPDAGEIRSTEMEDSASPMPTTEDLQKLDTEAGEQAVETNTEDKAAPTSDDTETGSTEGSEETESTEGPKRDIRYQQELIEQFISQKPTIPKQPGADVDDAAGQVDLSLQTLEFQGDVVSETLAKIFVKQGKLEKARDIYKKLIWKYPQKKAYFAAQIEDLKG